MVEANFAYQHAPRDANHPPEPLYSPRHLTQTNPAFHPARPQQNAPDLMLPTTAAEHAYLLQPGRPQTLGPEHLTPNSAVSSFNLPAQYDALLMTPVSMTGSPCLQNRTSPLISGGRDIKLSPTSLSPYQLYHEEDDFASKYHLPMKHKNPTSTLQVRTNDAGFPHVFDVPEPFFGSFGVSTSSASGRVLPASPSLHHIPNLNSAGGRSSVSYHSHQSTPPLSASSTVSYQSTDGTPVLVAPNPLTLRPAMTKKDKAQRRQLSVQSNDSTSSSVSTQPKKRRSPSKESANGVKKKRNRPEIVNLADLSIPGDLNSHERRLLDLTTIGLEWKEVVKRWSEETGHTLSVACVQMRKKRLMDRIKNYNALNSSPREWGENWSPSARNASSVSNGHSVGNAHIVSNAHGGSPEASSPKNWHEPWSPPPARNGSNVSNAHGGSPEASSPKHWHQPRSAVSPYHNGLPSYPEYTSAAMTSRLTSAQPVQPTATTTTTTTSDEPRTASQLYERAQYEQAQLHREQHLYAQQRQTSQQQEQQSHRQKEDRNTRIW